MSAQERPSQLSATEQHLIPPDLRRAAEFLRSAKNPGEGWGAYPRITSDLWITAQAISALHALQYPKTKELATSVAAWAHARYQQQTQITSHDAIALITIAAVDQEIEGIYPEALRSVLGSALSHVDSDRASTLTLAQALLATELWSVDHKSPIQPWVDELVRRGQGADAWHKAGVPAESLPVTALVVRALQPWRHQAAVDEVLQRGSEHLCSYLATDGWGATVFSGTYTLALMLRALAADPNADTELFEEGLELLRSRQRADGGWATAEPDSGNSSVEHTATAITALAESGACRFVPLIATRSIIHELTISLDRATKRQAALEEDIESQVEERINQALKERQQLRRRVKEREAEIKRLRELHEISLERVARLEDELGSVRKSSQTSFRIRPYWLSYYWSRIIAAGLILGVGITVAFLLVPSKEYIILTPIITAVVAVIGIGVTLNLQIRAREAAEESSLAMRQYQQGSRNARYTRYLVDEFVSITADVPPSTKEELVYRLAREGTDLPPDLFLRFLTELTSGQLHIRDPDQRLRSWMEEFSTLGLQDRNALIAQLRQAIL